MSNVIEVPDSCFLGKPEEHRLRSEMTRRLARLVRDSVGTLNPECCVLRLSPGQAKKMAVSEEVCAYLRSRPDVDIVSGVPASIYGVRVEVRQ